MRVFARGDHMTGERFLKMFASTCLGLLVGTLIGLSIHAAAGAALAALLALLGGFLGLTKTDQRHEDALKMASFSIATLVALLLSVYARTHELLSPNYEAELASLQRRHLLSEREAHALLIYERFGILPRGLAPADAGATKQSTVLFSTPQRTDCANLQSQLFTFPKERINAMRALGGPWSSLAATASQQKQADQKAVLDAGFDRLCNQ